MKMNKTIARFACLALLVLLAPAGQAAAQATDHQRLMKRDAVRHAAMDRLSRWDEAPPAPPLPPVLGDARAVCASSSQRRVDVADTAQLEAALAGAQPGDLIMLADGVYQTSAGAGFLAEVSGTAGRPITLCGSRAAVLEGRSLESGYGFSLRADHWVLAGFTVRGAAKGVMVDGGNDNLLYGLEVSQIGEEGVHFRAFSARNRIERSWIHHVGLVTPQFGEGIYIGSAHSNWGEYSGGQPDASDNTLVIGNVLGPEIAAEAIDAKEGTSGGVIRGNTFIGSGMTAADSWVDLKGNGYRVENNAGLWLRGNPPAASVAVLEELPGWGQANLVGPTTAVEVGRLREPFRAALGDRPEADVVLPARPLPYSLAELAARFPASFERAGLGVVLVKEPVVAARGARLVITSDDARELRLLSGAERSVSLAGFRGELSLSGTQRQRLVVRSWDVAAGGPDTNAADGRAYLLVRGARMDIARVDFADLGYGTGFAAGVAWKGVDGEPSSGGARDSRFERNAIGALVTQAQAMEWRGNLFADNQGHGFAARDGVEQLVFERNIVADNGGHGVVFARRCRDIVVRGNSIFGNQGSGMFVGGAPGEDVAPCEQLVLEHNSVDRNTTGIRLGHSRDTLLRGNTLRANRGGIVVATGAERAVVAGNAILRSARVAVAVRGEANGSRIEANAIGGGTVGVLVDDARATLVRWNAITGVRGRALVLRDDVTFSYVGENLMSGRGLAALDFRTARGLTADTLGNNDTTRWVQTGSRNLLEAGLMFLASHLALITWIISLSLPFVSRVWLWKKPELLLRNGPQTRMPSH
jgi:parallel beta-helix repeat protein